MLCLKINTRPQINILCNYRQRSRFQRYTIHFRRELQTGMNMYLSRHTFSCKDTHFVINKWYSNVRDIQRSIVNEKKKETYWKSLKTARHPLATLINDSLIKAPFIWPEKNDLSLRIFFAVFYSGRRQFI